MTQAALASRELKLAEEKVDAVDIHIIDMISRLHESDKLTIRRSNHHYAKWALSGSVENLAWSSDQILSSCEDSLRDKV